jgi:hypothetical protein
MNQSPPRLVPVLASLAMVLPPLLPAASLADPAQAPAPAVNPWSGTFELYGFAPLRTNGTVTISGQEAVVISETDLRLADVQAVALTGRHWLDTRWAVNYEWSSTRYGDFYTRSGWRIGVQHLF